MFEGDIYTRDFVNSLLFTFIFFISSLIISPILGSLFLQLITLFTYSNDTLIDPMLFMIGYVLLFSLIIKYFNFNLISNIIINLIVSVLAVIVGFFMNFLIKLLHDILTWISPDISNIFFIPFNEKIISSLSIIYGYIIVTNLFLYIMMLCIAYKRNKNK